MDSTTLEWHSPTSIPSMSNPLPNASLDQVSSLREAALSTLRAKRRKPGLEKGSLSRPPPPQSIQLDYGQEESQQPTTKPASLSPPKTVTQGNAEEPEPVSEDVQMREEGEISEEEDVVPALQARKEVPKSPMEDAKLPPAKPTIPGCRFSVAPKDLSQPTTQSRRSSEPSTISPQSVRHRSTTPAAHLSAAHVALLALDKNHVRPGVQMTQQQYDTAKDIILDLLGWGVPPEYLVECGLSTELVFYVFAELNLRLPRNLDTTGLIPYTPEAMSTARQAAAATMQVEVPGSSPDSPVKAGNDVSYISQPAESSSSPTSKSTISSRSLHDIEMQRRQELLARKRAALASRKSKQSSSTNSVTALPPDSMQSVTPELTSAVPPDVDSFLKSISASKIADVSASTSSSDRATSLPKSDDGMDMDDIPRLVPGVIQSAMSPSNQLNTLRLSSPSEEQLSLAHQTVQSLAESSHYAIEKSDSLSSVGSSTSTKSIDGQSRRGTKRPVASDFVDLDINTRLPPTNGRYNHGSTHLNLHQIRRAGAIDFGSVNNGHRRCVIDLSDSEEEFRNEDNTTREGKRSVFNVAGSFSTPPVIPVAPVSPSGTKEPSQLEMEIQRMKELIAKKEQDRLRKLASRVQNPLESLAVDDSLHSKSPVILDKPNNIGLNDTIMSLSEPYESSETSIPTIAAALAGPSTSATTPAIDDDTFVPIADRMNADVQPIDVESAEDVVMENVIDGHVTNTQEDVLIEHVDVDGETSSSAQVTLGLPKPSENLHEHELLDYQSPLALYPHLLSRHENSSMESEAQSSTISLPFSIQQLASTDRAILTNDSRGLKTDTDLLDLKLLKLVATTKRLDPWKRICQYEIPGGGACRDGTCEDNHLSRLINSDDQDEIEPNDDDTAEYLFNKLPREWLQFRDVKSAAQIHSALEKTRRLRTSLEDRVTRALAVLKPPAHDAPPE